MNNDEEIIEIGPDSIVSSKKVNKIDIEKKFNYINPFFIIISFLLVIVFVIQINNGLYSLGEEVDLSNFTYKYSNYKDGGTVLGIFTSIFLHGGIDHIVGNLVFFYIFSLVINSLFGFTKSLFLFILLGVIAGIPGYFLHDVPSIGASGAIFGVFGVVTIFYFLYKDKLSENLLDASWVLLFLALYIIFLGFTDPFVDNVSHVSGYIGGLFIGYFLLENKKILDNF